jgi:hypothetical protein
MEKDKSNWQKVQLTNYTHKIQKGQLKRNAKYDNKRQLKRNWWSNKHLNWMIKYITIKKSG